MKIKKIPLRKCVVSQERLEKKDLFRIVKNKDGEIFVDDTLKANGRGCYLKKDKEVILKAASSKVLNKVFECDVDNAIYEQLLSKI